MGGGEGAGRLGSAADLHAGRHPHDAAEGKQGRRGGSRARQEAVGRGQE